MIVWTLQNGRLVTLDSLITGLGICPERHRLIAAVGGGGKTSFLYALAEEFAARGEKVIVSTTTHMALPEKNFVPSFEPEALKAALERSPVITAGLPTGTGKINNGEDRELPRRLLSLCHRVLIEADGAKRLPMKAPGPEEPVMPEETDLVVGVLGAAALGKPLGEVCFRRETAAALLGCTPETPVTTDMLAALLASPEGQRKLATGDYRALLGQGDLATEAELLAFLSAFPFGIQAGGVSYLK